METKRDDLKEEKKLIKKKPEIPDKIFGVTLEEDDKQRLLNNQYTSLLTGIQTEPGIKKDGKIKLIKNNNDEYEFAFLFKHKKLEIPEQIDGYKLSSEEKDNLLNGKIITIVDSKKKNYNISIDNELNRIVIATENRIKTPKIIGGYKLTKDEKEDFKNGKQLKNHVFENEGRFFSANVTLNKEKTGLVFLNIKALTRKEVKERENKIKANVTDDVIRTGINGIKPEEKKILSKEEIDHEIEKAIKKRNFIRVYEMRGEGKEASKELKDKFMNDKTLNKQDKEKFAKILNIKQDVKEDKKLNERIDGLDISDDEKNKVKVGKEASEIEKEKEEIKFPAKEKEKKGEKVKDNIGQTERIVTTLTREL